MLTRTMSVRYEDAPTADSGNADENGSDNKR